ncbi:MAG: P-loop NTPase fold protein [Desulfomonilaceae bacterium]
MFLSDFICPNTNVNRSVNIERDVVSDAVIQNYKLTQKGLHILDRFVEALENNSQTSWSLTGPYGMGKSSFLSFVIALCGKQNDPKTILARDRLLLKNPNLLQRLLHQLSRYSASSSGLIRIPIVSAYQSVTTSVAHGLLSALSSAVDSEEITNFRITFEYNRLREDVETDKIDAQRLIKSISSIRKVMNAPIIIAIDEFGKNRSGPKV